MGYKVFYSFQTDTDSKLNWGFIRKAINNAIKNIKEIDIDPLLEGFRGVGGNPPLLEAMLGQSEMADVFIGDITFTSSKIWQSKGIGFTQDGDNYFIEIPKSTDLKPAPNPNVLIETGYSWKHKNFDRTILVMNGAFGNPELLPVDMKGVRRPITYNLTEVRANDPDVKAEELKGLTKALEGAIRNAINSTIEYQRSKISPMLVYSTWAEQQAGDFVLTPKNESILSQLRDLVLSKQHIRVFGPPNVGKSRMIYELFRKNGNLPAMQEKVNRIVYHDFDGPLEGDISKQMHRISELNQEMILILDNCPNKKVIGFEKLFRGKNIKLISIGTEQLGIIDGFEISKEDSVLISKQILSSKFPQSQAEKLAFELDGDVKRAIQSLSFEVLKEGEVDFIEIIKQQLGEGNIAKGAVELLTQISLFKFLGIKNNNQTELLSFKESFYPDIKLGELLSIIEILAEQRLVVKKGDFIQVDGDNEELVYHWWKEMDDSKINAIHKITNERLLRRISQKLVEIHKRTAIPNLENNLFGESKFLNLNEYYKSNEGKLFLNELLVIFPEKVLELMSLIVKDVVK